MCMVGLWVVRVAVVVVARDRGNDGLCLDDLGQMLVLCCYGRYRGVARGS